MQGCLGVRCRVSLPTESQLHLCVKVYQKNKEAFWIWKTGSLFRVPRFVPHGVWMQWVCSFSSLPLPHIKVSGCKGRPLARASWKIHMCLVLLTTSISSHLWQVGVYLGAGIRVQDTRMSASSLIPFKWVHYLFKSMLEEVYSHKAKLGSIISQSHRKVDLFFLVLHWICTERGSLSSHHLFLD